MAKKTISWEVTDEFLDKYCMQQGYKTHYMVPTPDEKTGILEDVKTPNPQSKVDFVEGILINHMEAVVAEKELEDVRNAMKEQNAKSGSNIVRIKKK